MIRKDRSWEELGTAVNDKAILYHLSFRALHSIEASLVAFQLIKKLETAMDDKAILYYLSFRALHSIQASLVAFYLSKVTRSARID